METYQSQSDSQPGPHWEVKPTEHDLVVDGKELAFVFSHGDAHVIVDLRDGGTYMQPTFESAVRYAEELVGLEYPEEAAA